MERKLPENGFSGVCVGCFSVSVWLKLKREMLGKTTRRAY